MSIVTKIKNVTGKFNKIRKEQGTRAAFDEIWALGTYVIYDRWKIQPSEEISAGTSSKPDAV